MNYINIKKAPYNAKGDGVTNDTQVFSSVIDNNHYPKIYVPGTYVISNLTILNKNVEILFESKNAIFLFSKDADFVFESKYTNMTSVIAASTFGNTSVITVSDSEGFAVGDVIKLVSEDAISGLDTDNTEYVNLYGGKARVGEIRIIESVNGNTITLAGDLIHSYLINIRIGKQGVHSLKMRGGSIKWANTNSFTPLQIKGGMEHDISLNVMDNFYKQGIRTLSTHSSKINLFLGKADNNTTGILDAASNLLTVTYKAKGLRHPLTTGGTGSTNSTDLLHYGITTYMTVENSEVNGTTESAFDCHVQAYKCTYRNSRAINNDNKALQDRGEGNIYENLVLDATQGITVKTEHRMTSRTSYFYNCIIGRRFSLLGTHVNIRKVLFNGCTFNLSKLSTSGYANVSFENCIFHLDYALMGATMLQTVHNSTYNFINCTFVILTQNASNRVRIVDLYADNSNITFSNCNVLSLSGGSQNFCLFRYNTGNATMDKSNVYIKNIYTGPLVSLYGNADDFNRWSGGQTPVSTISFTFDSDRIVMGSGPPVTSPPFIGAEYLDTANNKYYKAFGVNSNNNWIVMN